ncbi:hypothetical protein EDF56_102533 [Novosphingobium sp. PhB165]|uniref:SphA family protein n=1 Tax=Novosphingobium sp. PhB165 TaxID=2485105 RepID=UPI001051E73D|nr:transporter [Novosphingobium sp. PhB165]TCM20870.1 hypothetical protein EDF56_102533 [Novosphingobium sp. PhB165]
MRALCKASAALAVLSLGLPGAAYATEGGTSLYLLGSGGPGTAVMPPVEGIFYDKTIYVYDGSVSAKREFPINGNVVAGLDATIVADFETILLVPSTNFLGGTIAVGGIMPFGAPMMSADAVLTGPNGGVFSANRRDTALTTGDPVGVIMLGWHGKKLHAQLATLVSVPVGNYREGQLANLSLHRWAVDQSVAVSWHDPESGWDVSAKGGYTFNGRNDVTDYSSGDEIHLEGAVEKALSKKFSLGAQAYYQKQVTSDQGPLGSFKGEAVAVGGTAALNVVMARTPATFRARIMHELDTTNRLQGDSFWLDFSIPLKMNIPKQ